MQSGFTASEIVRQYKYRSVLYPFIKINYFIGTDLKSESHNYMGILVKMTKMRPSYI